VHDTRKHNILFGTELTKMPMNWMSHEVRPTITFIWLSTCLFCSARLSWDTWVWTHTSRWM